MINRPDCIKVRSCSFCPFAGSDDKGIFQHTYCTFGLFTHGDWREFTNEELLAGMSEALIKERLEKGIYPARYPQQVPEWCPIREPVQIVLI